MLRTPFARREDCPRNGRQIDPAPPCRAEVEPAWRDGLLSLEGFSHLIVLYWLNQIGEDRLGADRPMIFAPPFDGENRGVFATRSPARPNPIGLSVVRLDAVEATAGVLHLRWLDCIDTTPLLDIKPYLPSTDAVSDASMGWLQRHRT